MTDYDELRRLAEAATPGPWRQPSPALGIVTAGGETFASSWDVASAKKKDAAYIAAANPAAVLDLLDEIDRLRRERDEALAKAEAWANSDFALGLVVEHLRQENGGLTPSWLLDMSEEWNDKRVPELENTTDG